MALLRIRNGLYGLFDISMQELLPCVYDYMYVSSDGYVEVHRDGKAGFFYFDRVVPTAAPSTQTVKVDGQAVQLEAIQIEYNGGGYTYYKLRDLGQALGFNVGWDGTIFIETDKPYNPND